MYKLALIDIDGTLVDRNGNVPKKNIEVIQKAVKNNKIVTICTGRNIYKTIPIIKKIGIEVPVVCMDGTLIYNPKNNKIIKDLKLQDDEIEFIFDVSSNKDAYVEISDGYKYYKYIKDKSFLKYDNFNDHNFFGYIKSYFGGIRYLNNFNKLKNIKGPIYQVVVAAESYITNNIKNEIYLGSFGDIEIRDYLWDNYLFINKKGIKKSMGMNMLCEIFNVSLKETIAIGDEMNDLDMIEAAGVGVAMGNAVESVKRVADFITDSNDNSGVAVALEKYFFDR